MAAGSTANNPIGRPGRSTLRDNDGTHCEPGQMALQAILGLKFEVAIRTRVIPRPTIRTQLPCPAQHVMFATLFFQTTLTYTQQVPCFIVDRPLPNVENARVHVNVWQPEIEAWSPSSKTSAFGGEASKARRPKHGFQRASGGVTTEGQDSRGIRRRSGRTPTRTCARVSERDADPATRHL